MRCKPQQTFPTRFWQTLYESYILDQDSLKKSAASGALFVTLDAEAWGVDHRKPSEIGITLIPAPENVSPHPSTSSLETFSESNGFQSHLFRIVGRDRNPHFCEAPKFGEMHDLEEHLLEDALVEVIMGFRRAHGSDRPLVLAGFDVHFEFQIFATFAVNDTVQIAAVLISLIQRDEITALFTIQPTWNLPWGGRGSRGIKQPQAKRVWGVKPKPKELFPYAVKVSRSSRFHKFRSARPFLGIFDAYEPTAVALLEDNVHGYICLKSLEKLERFVRNVDGSTIEGAVWTATSKYNPKVRPAQDVAELKTRKKEAVQAQADERRQERQLKKENRPIKGDNKLYDEVGGAWGGEVSHRNRLEVEDIAGFDTIL